MQWTSEQNLTETHRTLLRRAMWGYTLRVLILLTIIPAPVWFGGERWIGVTTGAVGISSLPLWIWTLLTLLLLRMVIGSLRRIERLNADLHRGEVAIIEGRMLHAEIIAPHLIFPVAIEIEHVVLRVPRRVELPTLPSLARAIYAPQSHILLAWEPYP